MLKGDGLCVVRDVLVHVGQACGEVEGREPIRGHLPRESSGYTTTLFYPVQPESLNVVCVY